MFGHEWLKWNLEVKRAENVMTESKVRLADTDTLPVIGFHEIKARRDERRRRRFRLAPGR